MPGARPPVVCTHKGLAFNGTFNSAHFSPRDMGVIGRQFPDITFYTYHSGYDGEYMAAYPGDDVANSSNRGVDAFVKSLRENAWDATRFVPPGLQHGNTVNMYAELGTTWWGNMGDANQATHLLGKLITYVGPRRIVLGTDCIWYGSPQPQFVMLRALQFSEEAKEFYNLPYGLDGDRWDPNQNALSGASYPCTGHPNVAGWPRDGRAHPERTIRNGIFGPQRRRGVRHRPRRHARGDQLRPGPEDARRVPAQPDDSAGVRCRCGPTSSPARAPGGSSSTSSRPTIRGRRGIEFHETSPRQRSQRSGRCW